MNSAPEVTRINEQLRREYGRENDSPKWRVVWSEDQFEQRFGTFHDTTPEGIFLRDVTEHRKVRKYYNIHGKYILERLLVVPNTDDGTFKTKLSYEPLWVFEDNQGNPLPPLWRVCRFVVNQVNENMAQHDKRDSSSPGPASYADPYGDNEQGKELRKQEIDELEESMFGNETTIGDALAYKQGVGFTTSKLKES